ncbi:MAG: 3-oxoacyl-[acyl-carrier protein] reductase [Limisphaerales bacterium]|jgi:3-oxoacyl-[acyl-carrier protein] reductase
MRLIDKVAVITGGARGIGKAVAELFTQHGAKVILWDVLDIGQQTAEVLNANGGEASFEKVSVTDREGVKAAAQKAVDTYGKIDILINNAGILRDKTLMKMSDEDWDLSIDINLTGIFNCTRAIVPFMREKGYGRIVSASSITGMRGNIGQTNYTATKAGIIGMTKTWAIELGKYGITANAIAPGYTQTEMLDSVPEEAKKMAAQQIPVRFLGEPIDIAYGYLYLASDEARYVNGVCLNIDGGVAR